MLWEASFQGYKIHYYYFDCIFYKCLKTYSGCSCFPLEWSSYDSCTCPSSRENTGTFPFKSVRLRNRTDESKNSTRMFETFLRQVFQSWTLAALVAAGMWARPRQQCKLFYCGELSTFPAQRHVTQQQELDSLTCVHVCVRERVSVCVYICVWDVYLFKGDLLCPFS